MPDTPVTECGCVNVDFGSYENIVVLWPPPAFGFTRVPLGIDRCIALEILDLWRAGIKTIASCCGHNKQPAIISVFPEHDDWMVAQGYARCPDHPNTFYAKSIPLSERICRCGIRIDSPTPTEPEF
jgi:hypothetical protein